jgi:adenosylmethionine-8-amino-7-oxononanoate aminotransferase
MKYRRQSYEKWLHNFAHVSPAYYYRRGEGLTEEAYKDECIAELVTCIEQNDPSTIAAFIAEPVVGAALGAVPPPPGYFREIREVCDRYGILFIADEVMTGFGRLGAHFGIERFGATPDIIAAGKGISGGYYPLSAVIASEKVCAPFEAYKAPFLGGHTFACNPVGAAVGSFVIDYMASQDLTGNAKRMGEVLQRQLQVLKQSPMVGDIRGEGLLWGVELVKDTSTKEPFASNLRVSKQLFNEALNHQVILYPGSGSVNGVEGDHILISPPLCIQEKEIDTIVDAFAASLAKIEAALLQEN